MQQQAVNAVASDNSRGGRDASWTLLYEVDRYHGTWLQSQSRHARTYLSPGSLVLLHHDRPFLLPRALHAGVA